MLQIVNSYFDRRGLVKGEIKDDILFLMSEIGELVNAIRYQTVPYGAFSEQDYPIFDLIEDCGLLCEQKVSPKEWVRNNEAGYRDIPDEIGDVLMMLVRVADHFQVEPLEAMLAKMGRKENV